MCVTIVTTAATVCCSGLPGQELLTCATACRTFDRQRLLCLVMWRLCCLGAGNPDWLFSSPGAGALDAVVLLPKWQYMLLGYSC